MIPWEHLDTAQIPGGGELRLMRRGAELSIMSGSIELMNSRLSGSEQALAELTCAPLAGAARPRVLIGGLGMGFTLRAALAALPAAAEVVVAELVPAVVEWARGPMAQIFAGCLEDPRVAIRVADVADLIAEAQGAYDAILLDVDNGPGGLNRAANDGLYGLPGLAAAAAALGPGGVLAVWSATPDDAFAQRLRRSGYLVEEKRVRATGSKRGARHVIWLARKPAGEISPVARPSSSAAPHRRRRNGSPRPSRP
ncbi:polyamine aminopropyltransferase [Phenylobacterium soli]|uniref:Spermidine synthase n=1 Tax=Phenylobacterium soli TaxID=2170551 RepID=A0A328AMY1_9CAUL|nr:spermidine synthase [Phenylobacterium soli]RAK54258.1 spermidine synthase [Phenylobacterium soli]